MNHLDTIKQKAQELLAAMLSKARYRDTWPKQLAHTYALLYELMTEQNPYRITNVFGDRYLSEKCLDFVKTTVGCSDEELDKYLTYLEGIVFIVRTDDISAFDAGDYIDVIKDPLHNYADE